MQFGDIAATGSYFKGDDYAHAVALLVEVKQLDRQVPTNYGPKDTITADITVFSSIEDIDADNGTLNPAVKIQQTDLVRRISHLVGSATVVTVEKLPKGPKLPNGAWVWRQVDPEVKSKVVAYAQRRESGQTAAPAEEEMPDFLQ